MKGSVLSKSLMLIIFGSFLYYLWSHPDLFATIRGISYINVGILAVLGFLLYFFNVLILRTFLYTFNICIPISECFGISSISAIGNYLAPFGGGTVGKAVYLKRQYDLPYTGFLASMSAASILDFLWAGFLGSTVLIATGKIAYPWGQALLVVFLSLIIVPFMVLSINLRIYERRFFKVVRDALDGWKTISRNRELMVKVSLLLLAGHLVSSVELIAGYRAFSIKMSVSDAILLGAISSLASIMRFTPANIGIQEAVIALSSHLLGIGLGEGLLVAGLLRVVSMGVVFMSSGIYVIGFGNIMKGQAENEARQA